MHHHEKSSPKRQFDPFVSSVTYQTLSRLSVHHSKSNNNSNDGTAEVYETGGVQENSDHETDGDQNDTDHNQDASEVGRIDVAQNTNHIIQGKRLPMLLPKEMTHKTIKNFIKNPFLLTQQERKPTTK